MECCEKRDGGDPSFVRLIISPKPLNLFGPAPPEYKRPAELRKENKMSGVGNGAEKREISNTFSKGTAEWAHQEIVLNEDRKYYVLVQIREVSSHREKKIDPVVVKASKKLQKIEVRNMEIRLRSGNPHTSKNVIIYSKPMLMASTIQLIPVGLQIMTHAFIIFEFAEKPVGEDIINWMTSKNNFCGLHDPRRHLVEDQQLSDARKLGYVNQVIRNNEILNKACREAKSQDPASSFSVKSISSHERDVSLRRGSFTAQRTSQGCGTKAVDEHGIPRMVVTDDLIKPGDMTKDVGPGMKKVDGSRRKSVGEVLEAKFFTVNSTAPLLHKKGTEREKIDSLSNLSEIKGQIRDTLLGR